MVSIMMQVFLFAAAYSTDDIGVHPDFGTFVMGIILPRREIFLTRAQGVSHVNSTLFLPLFFVYSGLRTQVNLINQPILWLVCLLVLLIACSCKIVGGTLSMHWMGESWHESFSLGILMNTRGLVELIVLNIGLDLGVLIGIKLGGSDKQG